LPPRQARNSKHQPQAGDLLVSAITMLMVLFLIRAFVLMHEGGHVSLFCTAWLKRASCRNRSYSAQLKVQ